MNQKIQTVCRSLLRKKVQVRTKLEELPCRLQNALRDNSGMSHTVEIMLWILGVAVVAAIVVTAVIALINTDILPQIKTKITEIFSHTA